MMVEDREQWKSTVGFLRGHCLLILIMQLALIIVEFCTALQKNRILQKLSVYSDNWFQQLLNTKCMKHILEMFLVNTKIKELEQGLDPSCRHTRTTTEPWSHSPTIFKLLWSHSLASAHSVRALQRRRASGCHEAILRERTEPGSAKVGYQRVQVRWRAGSRTDWEQKHKTSYHSAVLQRVEDSYISTLLWKSFTSCKIWLPFQRLPGSSFLSTPPMIQAMIFGAT